MTSILSDEQTYTTREVCELSELTYRQIDSWNRWGWITPVVPATGSGSKRAWSLQQTEVLMNTGAALESITDLIGQDPKKKNIAGVLSRVVLEAIQESPEADGWEISAGNVTIFVNRAFDLVPV